MKEAWFFVCWYRFMENRSCLKNIGMNVVKNGRGHSVLRTLKLNGCQGEMNGINWFLVCWYKFRKAKSYFNNFLVVVVVKNGQGLLGLGTLKAAVSQEPIDEMSRFFACWYKFRNEKWWKMRRGFRDHGTLKSGASHKWFDELSRLIEWFLCTDSGGMVFSSNSSLLYVFDIYFVLVISTWLTLKPNNLRKFYSQILENMIKPPSLQKGFYKISSGHLPICLSVCLWHIFLRIYSVDVLNFLHEDILPYILKSDKARFWKIVFVF